MISSVELLHSRAWRDHLGRFNPEKQTWIVADLRAKLELQQILFTKHKCVSEHAVLRASELWQKIFIQHHPDFKIVSNFCLQAQLNHWLAQEEEDWLQRPGASQSLLAYIQQFLPIFVHPEGMSSVTTWLETKENALVRWGKWLFVAQKYFEMFYQRRWLAGSWLVSLLSGSENLQLSWPRPLFVDLGTQMSPLELNLFGRLHKSQPVQIFKPKSSSYITKHKAWASYALLSDKAPNLANEFSLEHIPSAKDQSKLRKFPTALAEVKDAVATLRTWLDAGANPWDVAILAPDIEEYWPLLQHYLQIEGIPCQKKVVTRLHSQSDVLHWLARMQIESGELTTGDLEQALYSHKGQFVDLHFDRFRKLFTNIYESTDIKRSSQAKNFFKLELDKSQTWLRDEFIAWSLQQWPNTHNTSGVENLMRMLVEDVPPNVNLSVKDWLLYTRNQCARIELTEREGQAQGIFCENLPLGRFLPVKKVYVLGLVEKFMKKTSVTNVSLEEVESLQQDLGFLIQSPEVSQMDAEMLWLIDQELVEITMSTSITNFKGDPESPSVLWLTQALRGGRDGKRLDSSGESRWDSLQKSPEPEDLKDLIAVDLGEQTMAAVQPPKDLSLSVTRIERFESCPFVFMAESLFKLSDDLALDLDMDPLSKGSLDHAIFETLSEEPMVFERSDKELEEIVEKCRKEEDIPISSLQHWRILRTNHIEKAKRFLEFEKQWRQKYTKTKTIGRETWFEVAWDHSKKDFVALSENNGIDEQKLVFRGQIDRVDSDEDGHGVIIDYKSSGHQTRNYKSWLKNSVQLGVYSYLVERGLTNLGPLEIWGAAYYVMRDFKRNKGLWRHDVESSLFEAEENKNNSLDKESLQEFYQQVLSRVSFLIDKVESGNYSPEPKDFKDCFKCRWSHLCRAPHLN